MLCWALDQLTTAWPRCLGLGPHGADVLDPHGPCDGHTLYLRGYVGPRPFRGSDPFKATLSLSSLVFGFRRIVHFLVPRLTSLPSGFGFCFFLLCQCIAGAPGEPEALMSGCWEVLQQPLQMQEGWKEPQSSPGGRGADRKSCKACSNQLPPTSKWLELEQFWAWMTYIVTSLCFFLEERTGSIWTLAVRSPPHNGAGELTWELWLSSIREQ